FNPDLTKVQLAELIHGMSDLDVARLLYCQEIAGAYLAVASFEETLITAMLMCDLVKIKKVLGSDSDNWQNILSKKTLLQDSTLGSLINILEKHDINQHDINYLRWMKNKRDYFIHRLFHDGDWPGNLDEESCRIMSRRLLAIQMWMTRASHRIWPIFERAGLYEIKYLRDGSILAFNRDLFENDASPNT
ncbi:MAG: hypothetical protein ABJ201_22595, partial [Nisaea sp.]